MNGSKYKIIRINTSKIKAIIKISALILLFFFCVDFLTNLYMRRDKYIESMLLETERKLIIIDAGHGGEDPGTLSKSGIMEKDLNLEFAYTIGAMFAERGYAVLYTRTKDKLLYTDEENIKGIRKISDLKNRCKIAAEYPEALFISIHMNSYKNSKYKGLQVYYSENNVESQRLAQSVQDKVSTTVQLDNSRKIKPGNDIYLLENAPNTTILIECGFLSNPEEAEKLSEKEYQKELSLAIVCGIIEYKDMIQSN